MKVKVLQGQSLVDIAMQVYGSAEGVFLLAKENGLSVTDSILPGMTLYYDNAHIVNREIAGYLASNHIYPATECSDREKIFDFTFDDTFN